MNKKTRQYYLYRGACRRHLLFWIHSFQKNCQFCLFTFVKYETLLIELRSQYASSVYIIPTRSKIYNTIRKNRGSMFVNKIH
ncbi:hypothetical protein HZS_5579 [Henneguya salminicola]|nr:hypothetical protein HZS_5579 [Henneguya salminicola]